MPHILKETILTLKLSYDEFLILVESLWKTYSTTEQASLLEDLLKFLNKQDHERLKNAQSEVTTVDFKPGDNVILLTDFSHIDSNFAFGSVLEVREVYPNSNSILVAKHGTVNGHFINKSNFVRIHSTKI